jgi:Manganese containing catalase
LPWGLPTFLQDKTLERVVDFETGGSQKILMYHHVKKLMYTVRVDNPDPAFGNMLLEQFGGANGELAAAMQYSVQGLNCEDTERKDLLMDNRRWRRSGAVRFPWASLGPLTT